MNPFSEKWRITAEDLGIVITCPYDLVLPSGRVIHADVYVHDFGGSKGNLIFRSFDVIPGDDRELVEFGYGYSVMGIPTQPYDREVMIEVLSDWGWTGNPFQTPDWLIEVSED